MSVDLGQVSQLIVSCATLVTAMGGIILAMKHNAQSDVRKEEIKSELKQTVIAESVKVREATDGIVDKLIASTAVSSKAEGVLQEKDRQEGKTPSAL